jgi:hypothetical protein
VRYNCAGIVTLLLISAVLVKAHGQDGFEDTIPSVYIDCESCDLDFIKTEIPYVNYAIDPAHADVYVLVTTCATAGEGTEHTLTFTGQQLYKGIEDTLVFVSQAQDSEDRIRKSLVQRLALGLMRYCARSTLADDFIVEYRKQVRPVIAHDPWHQWVFSISIQTYLNGEQNYHDLSTYSSVSAQRITDRMKTEFLIFYDYDKNYFRIDDTTTISSVKKSYGGDVFIARGLDDHWSWGMGADIYSSTYRNKDYQFYLWPALEFNIFPYGEATRRELRLTWKVGYGYTNYTDETIYDKTEEKYFHESLAISLDTKQPWGSTWIQFWVSHYFHDVTKNRVSVSCSASLHLLKGFSLNVYAYAAWIHDQLSLAKRDLTPEEIILQIKQQATQYDYSVSIGLTYTFGSIYSNIVNPRFGQ